MHKTKEDRNDMEIGHFSLRTMFVGIGLLCLATFGLSGRPSWFAGIAFSFITLLVPAALAAGIVHGDKYLKTFCAGAMTGAPVGLVYFTHMVFGFLRDEPSLNILETFTYVATTNTTALTRILVASRQACQLDALAVQLSDRAGCRPRGARNQAAFPGCFEVIAA